MKTRVYIYLMVFIFLRIIIFKINLFIIDLKFLAERIVYLLS